MISNSPPHGTRYAIVTRQLTASTIFPYNGHVQNKGETATMKKKVRRFVLYHEYFCVIVLSVIGALLTTIIVG